MRLCRLHDAGCPVNPAKRSGLKACLLTQLHELMSRDERLFDGEIRILLAYLRLIEAVGSACSWCGVPAVGVEIVAVITGVLSSKKDPGHRTFLEAIFGAEVEVRSEEGEVRARGHIVDFDGRSAKPHTSARGSFDT